MTFENVRKDVIWKVVVLSYKSQIYIECQNISINVFRDISTSASQILFNIKVYKLVGFYINLRHIFI